MNIEESLNEPIEVKTRQKRSRGEYGVWNPIIFESASLFRIISEAAAMHAWFGSELFLCVLLPGHLMK